MIRAILRMLYPYVKLFVNGRCVNVRSRAHRRATVVHV